MTTREMPVCDTSDPASLEVMDAVVTERFWRKVSKGDGCWNWIGAIQGAGYGTFWVGKKCKLAHRISYESLTGPIPDGLVIDHLCRNRACVNPKHLEVVTNRINILRGETIAARNVTRTHCPKGHPYSGDNLRIGRSGGRYCRQCLKIRDDARPRIRNPLMCKRGIHLRTVENTYVGCGRIRCRDCVHAWHRANPDAAIRYNAKRRRNYVG